METKAQPSTQQLWKACYSEVQQIFKFEESHKDSVPTSVLAQKIGSCLDGWNTTKTALLSQTPFLDLLKRFRSYIGELQRSSLKSLSPRYYEELNRIMQRNVRRALTYANNKWAGTVLFEEDIYHTHVGIKPCSSIHDVLGWQYKQDLPEIEHAKALGKVTDFFNTRTPKLPENVISDNLRLFTAEREKKSTAVGEGFFLAYFAAAGFTIWSLTKITKGNCHTPAAIGAITTATALIVTAIALALWWQQFKKDITGEMLNEYINTRPIESNTMG